MNGNMENKKLKVVAISDTHGTLPQLPECDVVCHCGDFSPLEYQRDMVSMGSWFCLKFLPWVESLPCKKFIMVGGNHDFYLEYAHKRLISMTPYVEYTWRSASDVTKKLLPGDLRREHNKFVYLCDSSYEYEGKRFYGTPYIRDLKNWAFYRNEEDLLEKYKNIPKKCDVILTHMPPKIEGLGEVIQSGCFNTGADYGSPELAEVLQTRDFQYALCGHVHSGQHLPVELDGKKLVNVSLKNEDYKEQYYPFEFEI